MFFKNFFKKTGIYWLSFLIPFIIMMAYFAYRNMAPFGNGSILTVDLGQQYVDFFAYFKHAILNDPRSFFYSFSKAFGGEMMGVWAYYLMSPLNLILLFFSTKSLTSGILIILLLKYGLAGLSMSYLINHSFKVNPWITISMATAYALNGWIIANQLNVLWLDSMVLLPIVVLGVNQIIKKNRALTYTIALTASLIINYYMAYMICLFIILYFSTEMINNHLNWRDTIRKTIKWMGASLISGGLSAWLLLPTFSALKNSKGVYTVTKFKWQFEYSPFKFLAKFFNGSFNFSQMPNGTPNIFIGSIALIAFLLFLANPQFKVKKRLVTLILTIILVLSMMLQPLDLLWHAMQFPIWYPYRFSFIFCFWIIWIATQQLAVGNQQVSVLRKIIIALLIIIGTASIILQRNQFNFLTSSNLILGSLILIIAAIIILILKKPSPYIIASIILLTSGEMALNVFNSLNNISYVTTPNYVNYTQNLKQGINQINAHDSGFFRVGKTFYRTKDDPFEANYNGGEHFSSTFEANTPNFMDSIGEPAGDGFIEYANGTLLSDSLLNFKYFLHQNNPRPDQYLQALTDKPDLNRYHLIHQKNNLEVYQNPYALPIAFQASQNIFKAIVSPDPLHYQSNLYNQLAGTNVQDKLFKADNFSTSSFINTASQNTITGGLFRRKNLLKPAHIILNFTPQSDDSYYLTLGSNINDKDAAIKINDKPLNQYNVYRNTVTANIASRMKNQPIKIDIELLKGSLWLQNLTLYQMNNRRFKQLNHKLQSNQMNINHHTSNSFNGTINIKKPHQALVTTIPYESGWHLTANGEQMPIKKWANMFIGTHLNPGKYNIQIYYWPPLLTLGIIITLITISFIVMRQLIIKHYK